MGAHQALVSLPLQAQLDTMEKFQPKPGTRDMKRLFMGFLKSMGSPMQGVNGGMSQPGPGIGMKRSLAQISTSAPLGGADVYMFAEQRGLDEECVAALLDMPE